MRTRVTPRVAACSITLAVLVWADRAVAESADRVDLDAMSDGMFIAILAPFAIFLAAVLIWDVLRGRKRGTDGQE